MASKRKRYFRPKQSSRDQDFHHSPEVKRRKLSDDMGHSERGVLSYEDDGAKDQDGADEGWTTVTGKNSKRDRRDDQMRTESSDYPSLRIHRNFQSEIRLKDLRDLGLYVLADEAAPKWMAVNNSRQIKKVVVVMVPGMDENVLRRAQRLRNKSEQTTNGSNGIAEKADTVSNPATRDTEVSKTDVARHLLSQAGELDDDQPQSWLFNHILQVKGPGDTKMSKVHSPLQAMLLSQESDKKQQDNRNGHLAERTPITEFVHSADNLREAEFPIHPAAFTVELDAKLEAERREKAGQSVGNGWVDTKVTKSQPQTSTESGDPVSRGLSIYSLDCEMVQTSDGATSLARVSMISYPDGKLVMDKYVKPSLPITNYFTQFSGITESILENVTTTIQDVQDELLHILTPSSILLGHSLDSDLNALKLTHPFLVDTSIIYPHPRGLPLRSSLKYLANKYLKREIQTGGASGHNSVEDAQAVLDLVKLKCEKGPKWGTIEANGEPVFKRLKRDGRTSAMIEYGTPERGYGKDATYTIGCQNDNEVVKGVIRAIKGDDFFDFQIPAGGVDFVWGRLRALEFARGWVSGGSVIWSNINKDKSEQNGFDKTEEEDDKIDTIAIETLDRLQQIHDALPPKSLLMICSGTSDVRPVMRLQAQQQQYRKEFKVKKWDELSIKWTDTEEQALTRACEEARAGWGVCTIK